MALQATPINREQALSGLRRPVERFYEILLSGLHLGVTFSGGGWTLSIVHVYVAKFHLWDALEAW